MVETKTDQVKTTDLTPKNAEQFKPAIDKGKGVIGHRDTQQRMIIRSVQRTGEISPLGRC